MNAIGIGSHVELTRMWDFIFGLLKDAIAPEPQVARHWLHASRPKNLFD